MESARCPPLPKNLSPTQSAASKEEPKAPPVIEETSNVNIKDTVDEVKPDVVPQQVPEKVKATKAPDVSEATHESMSVKEPASQGSAPLADEEVQQKMAPGEAGDGLPYAFFISFSFYPSIK